MYEDSPAEAEFRFAKYRGIAQSLKVYADSLSANIPPPAVQYSLQINILEAVKLDIILGLEEKARVGLALAAAVRFGPTVEDHRLSWRLGKDWVDAYLAWNMAFVTGTVPPTFLSKLIIPAVSCTLRSEEGEDFIMARAVSLASSMMQIQTPLLSGISAEEPYKVKAMEQYYASQTLMSPEKSTLASTFGSINIKSLVLPTPSADAVEKMLFTLCGGRCHTASWKGADSNPVTRLSDDKFHVYLGYALWITCLLAGLGLELLVLLSFFQDGWSNDFEIRWRFAQFLFPLLAAATLGLAMLHNYMALILLVPGLWKFGFPETIMYLYFALYQTKDATRVQRIVELCNGVGTVVHHGAASLLIVMLLSGAIRPAQHIVNPILVLLMQHWFVLLKYVNTLLYTVLELALEVWFEWIVISELEEIFANHWTAALAANCMLVAHWLYLSGATLDLFKSSCLETDKSFGRSEETRYKYLQSFQIRKKKVGWAKGFGMSMPLVGSSHHRKDVARKVDAGQEHTPAPGPEVEYGV